MSLCRLGRSLGSLVLALCVALAAVAVALARDKTQLALRHVALDLPGPPAKILSSDLDGDGLEDLLVVVAYTEIETIGDSRFENLVEIATVIPALFDRRELRAYLAAPGGGYVPVEHPLALPTSVLHLEHGPESVGLVALTDAGLSRVTWSAEPPALRLVALIDDRPLLAGTEIFYSSLELVHDLDGDGDRDVLLPSRKGLHVYLSDVSGLSAGPAERIDLSRGVAPRVEAPDLPGLIEGYSMPEVGDINGDGRPDLVFPASFRQHHAAAHVLLGKGDGSFRPLRDTPEDCHDVLTDLRVAAVPEGGFPWPVGLTALRDLDGDGRAEVVTSEERARGESMRQELKDAKRPIHQYRFHRLTEGLRVAAEPYFETEILGHTMAEGTSEGSSFEIQRFLDLDADGRQDLITVTLDFSLLQVVKIMATKSIGVRLDFHVYAQHADGSFREVSGLDLSEKLRIDLDRLEIARFAQFAGDFDGDGRQDFVHLGRGRVVTLHRGQPGCRYGKEPDLEVELAEEPASLDLVRIEDLDGDDRSDLRVTRLLPTTDVDTTAPVRVDLYLSGGPR